MSRRVVAAFRDEADARGCAQGLCRLALRSYAATMSVENLGTLESYDARYGWAVTVEEEVFSIRGSLLVRVRAYVRGYTDACVEGVVVP